MVNWCRIRGISAFSLKIVFVTICVSSWWGCRNPGSDKLFRKLDPGETGIKFSNNLIYNDSLTVLEFEYMFNGAGVAFIDINNDTLQDVILGGNMVPTRLFLNKGHLKFEDITEKAGLSITGWANGISVVDINQDG